MKKRDLVFLCLIVLFALPIFAQENTDKPTGKAVSQKIEKLQIPFIANEGQADEKVAYYANTFGGTVFVTNDGEIVYALPNNSSDVETQGIASLRHSPDKIQQCRGELHTPDVIHSARCRIQDNRESCVKPCRLDEAERTQQSCRVGIAYRINNTTGEGLGRGVNL